MDSPYLSESTARFHVRFAATYLYGIIAVTILEMVFGFFGGLFLPALGLATPMLLAGGIGPNIAHSLLLGVGMSALLLVFFLIGESVAEGAWCALAAGPLVYIADMVFMLGSFPIETPVQVRVAVTPVHIIALFPLTTGWRAAARLEEIARSQATVRAGEATRDLSQQPGTSTLTDVEPETGPENGDDDHHMADSRLHESQTLRSEPDSPATDI